MSRRAVAAAVLLAFSAATLQAEGTPADKKHEPEPYTKEEFPEWARQLWRAEVVFVGSFPFTFFFVLEGYDTYKYAANDFSSSYAPWPFRTSDEITYTTDEVFWLVVSALASSAVVSLVDFILGHVGQQPANP